MQIGIVGAGVMGQGVAEASVLSGHSAILIDIRTELLERARHTLRNSLRARALSMPGLRVSDALGRVTFATTLASLHAAHFVVENVTENFESKRKAYHDIDMALPSTTVIAANTSTFPISELATLCSHPERLIGIHFMNPAGIKPLVEVIPSSRTSPEVLVAAIAFIQSIGKEGVIVGDAPGFVSNRILMLTINEAIRTVEAGIASAEDVDRIFVGCFGHAMGPLATADLIGLDTILLSLESLKARLAHPKYEASILLRTMVDEGRLGRKSGVGFFRYRLGDKSQ